MPGTVSKHRQTFRKRERLNSRKILQELSQKGISMHSGNIRLSWLSVKLAPDSIVQAAFSVPKKKFKNAPDRNRIKRRMREAYRKNKSTFYSFISNQQKQLALLFVYNGKETVSYLEVEKNIKEILTRLVQDIQKNNQ